MLKRWTNLFHSGWGHQIWILNCLICVIVIFGFMKQTEAIFQIFLCIAQKLSIPLHTSFLYLCYFPHWLSSSPKIVIFSPPLVFLSSGISPTVAGLFTRSPQARYAAGPAGSPGWCSAYSTHMHPQNTPGDIKHIQHGNSTLIDFFCCWCW